MTLIATWVAEGRKKPNKTSLFELSLPATDHDDALKVIFFDQHCIIPDCECNIAWLVPHLLEGDSAADWADEAAKIQPGIELAAGTLDFSETEGKLGQRVQQELSARLDEKMLRTLRKRHALTRKWGESHFWKYRDWTGIEPGGCLFWSEVFPTVPDFRLVEGDRVFYLVDQHCWNPNCECRQAIVTLLTIEPGQSEVSSRGELAFDYVSSAHKVLNSEGTTSAELRRVLALFLSHHPDLPAELFRRSTFLKTEFAPWLENAGFVSPFKRAHTGCAVPATPLVHDKHTKVGRNDPCYCGSGKKSKKCCAR